LAGLVTAARAAEMGLDVTVVEQGRDRRYPCNSRYSGGILHFAYNDVRSEPETLAAVAKLAMGEDANEDLITASAGAAGPALDWLSRFDTRFVRSSPVEWHRWTLAPPRPLKPGLDFPGSGPDTLLETLSGTVRALGGEILLGHRATDLSRDGDRWVLVADGEEGSRRLGARYAVLADGGFQGDRTLVQRYISQRPDLLVQRGAGTGAGFAVRMAGKLGLGLTGMDRFYGHVLSRDSLTNPGLWPYPQLDPLAANGIVVGPDGLRFADEGRGGVYIANEIAKLPDPSAAWAILDEAIWGSAGRQSLYPPNPHLLDAGGTLLRAETLDELARACALDPSVLAETVFEYNRAVEAGTDSLAHLDVPRSRNALAIRGPYIAVPIAAGITNTMGGLAVDANARVIDRNGNPVEALYAVGASAGGLEGGRNVGYVGGLMRALTSGLLAADDLGRVSGYIGQSSRNEPSSENAVAPRSRPRPTVLRVLAHRPFAISATTSAIAFAIVLVLAWPIIANLALLPAAGIGAIVFVLAKAFCELAAIILDVLVPG